MQVPFLPYSQYFNFAIYTIQLPHDILKHMLNNEWLFPTKLMHLSLGIFIPPKNPFLFYCFILELLLIFLKAQYVLFYSSTSSYRDSSLLLRLAWAEYKGQGSFHVENFSDPLFLFTLPQMYQQTSPGSAALDLHCTSESSHQPVDFPAFPHSGEQIWSCWGLYRRCINEGWGWKERDIL